MNVSQTQFRDAILDQNCPPPAGLIDGQGRPAGRRFSIYRNNVAVGLTEALADNFPAIKNLLGPNNFKAVTGVFLRQSLPPTPLIATYGLEFPKFLEAFPPLRHIGYLADIARLELALVQSFNAADTDAIDPHLFETIAPNALMTTQINLAPCLRLIRSPWPIYAIWKMNTSIDASTHIAPPATAQNVLITRPDFDPIPHLLPSGAAEFIAAIDQNQTLGKACDTALNGAPDFDLSATLGLLFQSQAIINLHSNGPAK